MKLFASIIAVAVGSARIASAISSQDPYAYNVTALTDPTIPPAVEVCGFQKTTCSQLCGPTTTNNCDPTDLSWACVCRDGPTPNITQFVQTMPYYECQQYKINCLASAGSSASAQHVCNNTPCPSKDPGSYVSSMAASGPTSMASSSSSPKQTGKSGSSGSGSGGNGGAAGMVSVSQSYGLGALVTLLLFAFGFTL